MNGPIFGHLCLKILIFLQIFSSETKIVIIICKLRLQTAKRVYKNQRTVYEYVNILFYQVYEEVIFSKTRYMIGVGFKKLARTPVSKLTSSPRDSLLTEHFLLERLI